MTTTEQDRHGLICTKCGDDTGCCPDLAHLSMEYVAALCSSWLCSECLDEREQSEVSGRTADAPRVVCGGNAHQRRAFRRGAG
jgi:hypothetical protein